jgi:hypothetical protein
VLLTKKLMHISSSSLQAPLALVLSHPVFTAVAVGTSACTSRTGHSKTLESTLFV